MQFEFQDLALGTKFKYTGKHKVWVKIDFFTIAEWNEDLKTSKWVGQNICCFDENNHIRKMVEVL